MLGSRDRRYARRLCVALLGLVLASPGCRHRSPAQAIEPASSSTGAVVELLVIGQARESASTRAVARELDRHLQAAATTERSAIVLWLGTDLGPRGPERSGRCIDPAQVFASPALAELAAVVTNAVERGASSWGLPGPDGWRCDPSGLLADAAPYRQPGAAYLLRVDERGTARLASHCTDDHCEIDPRRGPPLVELVALDPSPWLFRELADEARTEALLGQQCSLLEALAEQSDNPHETPRLLISPIPIESAGARGLGGRKQRTSFRYLPECVQRAIADGLFVGAIGALERDLQVSIDLSNAILRGDRSFIARPLFQLIAGSAGGASHTLPTSRGGSVLPELWSEHTGFARVLIAGTPHAQAQIHVHARVAGRWREATVTVPLDPEPLGPLRETPTIQPCPSCDPQAGAPESRSFTPRGRRRP